MKALEDNTEESFMTLDLAMISRYDTRGKGNKEQNELNGTPANVKPSVLQRMQPTVKSQPTELEKTFKSPVSDKGLTSRIYKEHLQFNKNKATRLRNELRT